MTTEQHEMFPAERFHFEVLNMRTGERLEADFNHDQWMKGGGHRLIKLMDRRAPFAWGTYSLRITRESGPRLNRRTEVVADRPKWFEVVPDEQATGIAHPRINFLDCVHSVAS